MTRTVQLVAMGSVGSSLGLLMLMAGFFACSDDSVALLNVNDAGGSAGPQDGGDLPNPDSGSLNGDAGAGLDAAPWDLGVPAVDDAGNPICTQCVSERLIWEFEGGSLINSSRSEVSACRQFVLTQRDPADPSQILSCTNLVPCQDPDRVSMNDVLAALNTPDVMTAFSLAPILYGLDLRLVDGAVLNVTLGNRTITIGAVCPGTVDCREIPPALSNLKELLMTLQSERLVEEDCSMVFPG